MRRYRPRSRSRCELDPMEPPLWRELLLETVRGAIPVVVDHACDLLRGKLFPTPPQRDEDKT